MQRRPRPATVTTLLPTFSALLAVQGCESPVCGDTPAEEIQRHGPEALRQMRRGEGSEALREVAIAVGLRPHGRSTRVDVAGAAPAVRVEPRVEVAGEMARVSPQPEPQSPVQGGLRRASPESPTPQQPNPSSPPQVVPGGMRAVGPNDPSGPSR